MGLVKHVHTGFNVFLSKYLSILYKQEIENDSNEKFRFLEV